MVIVTTTLVVMQEGCTVGPPVLSRCSVLTVRANCLATNTEYCDRCTHAATQATNVAQIKTEGTKGLLTVSGVWVRVRWKCEGLQMSCKTCG